MEELTNKKRLELKTHFQKAFRAVQLFHEELKTITLEEIPAVKLVVNLLQQLESCKSCEADEDCDSTDIFNEELKTQTTTQLENEIVNILDTELQPRIQKLKEKGDAVTRCYATAERLLEKNSASLDFDDVCVDLLHMGPSIARLMEWLENVCIFNHEQYYMKLHLLESVLSDDVNSKNFVQLWTDQQNMPNTIEGYLLNVEKLLGKNK